MPKTINDLINFANSSAELEHYPTPKDRLVKGNPQQNNRLHFSVKENFFAGEWEVVEPTQKIYVIYEK